MITRKLFLPSLVLLFCFLVLGSTTEAAKTRLSVRSAMAQTAQVNLIKAVLQPARTKGKLSLKVTLHNPTAAKATAFGVQATRQRRVVGKAGLNGLDPRARTSRSLLLHLPKQKGRICVDVRLTKPRGSKLKLGQSRKACLKSPMAVRGIGTSPSTKPGTTRGRVKITRGTPKTRLGTTSGRTKTIKGKKRLGVSFITVPGLNLNGQTSSLTVNPGQTVTANWSFSSGLTGNPNQVIIRVRQGGFPNIPNECQTGGGDTINSGVINGLSGNFNISLNLLTVGQTYSVKACLVNSGTGNTGDESNVVTLRYENPILKPDLVVTEMFQTGSGEIRFKVKNNGPGVKQPSSKIAYYSLKVRTISGPTNNKDIKAIAPFTTLSRMTPGTGSEWVQERILDYKTPKYGVHSFKVCINVYHRLKNGSYGRAIEETNYNNNCLTRTSDQLNPVDLSILSGTVHAGTFGDPEGCDSDKHWYLFEFNTCGIDSSYAELRIRNNGTGVAKNFYVALISPQFAASGNTPSRKVDKLNPGETKTIKVYIREDQLKKGDSDCCQLKAVIDVSNVVPETNEGNNEYVFTNVSARKLRKRFRRARFKSNKKYRRK